MKRRSFLKWFGKGAAVAVAAPAIVTELIEEEPVYLGEGIISQMESSPHMWYNQSEVELRERYDAMLERNYLGSLYNPRPTLSPKQIIELYDKAGDILLNSNT